jgi:hypothetical protein
VAAQTTAPRSALLPLRDRQVNSGNPQTLSPAPLFRPHRSPPPTPYAPRPGTGQRRSASDAFAQAAMMPVRMSVSAACHAIRRAFVSAAAATTSVRSAGIEDRQITTQSKRSAHISKFMHQIGALKRLGFFDADFQCTMKHDLRLCTRLDGRSR